MHNPKPKQRIKVLRACRGYEIGRIYTIERVDTTDNTLVATDSSGVEGSWLKWDACVLAGPEISWDWLKNQLPGDVLELLSAFHGLDSVRLKPEVRDHILLQLPDLKEKITESQAAIEEEFGPDVFTDQECTAQDEEEQESLAL